MSVPKRSLWTYVLETRAMQWLAVSNAVLTIIAAILWWADGRLDAWVDREEAKAAQPWRRTP